jgi:hypothetical protein
MAYINDITNTAVYPDLSGSIVGRINGCYCPPHKGHFFAWANACKELNLDVLFICATNHPDKYKSRHGIPLAFTEWVVSNWASQLQNADGKPVTVIFRTDPPLSKMSNNFKKFYLITYNDEYNEELKKQDELDPTIGWQKRIKLTQKKEDTNTWRIANKNFFRETGAASPSATKFTHCLKQARISGDKSACYTFLPDFMTDANKNEYIDKIFEEYYTLDSYADCNAKGYESERCEKFNFPQAPTGGKKKKPSKKRITKKKTIKRKKTKKTLKRKKASRIKRF